MSLQSNIVANRWRMCAGETLPLRAWDGDYVAYNPLSGNTHVLDVVGGEVLGAIMKGPLTGTELCRRIAEFLDVPNDARLEENIGQILAELDELGLIEPDDGC